MAFRDDLLLVLSGGIPALIDGPSATGGNGAATDNEGQPRTVERTPPEPQLQDREPFAIAGMNGGNFALGAGALVLGIIGVILVARNI